MTLQSKILLINIILAAAAVIGFAFATDTFPGNGFFLMLAFITFAGGFASIALSLLLLFKKNKRAGKAYLITSALLLLISLCSYFFLRQY